MATIVELAQRMLTKRPTVALTSEMPSLLAARSPTRAREPRTEITRPKDVTCIEPVMGIALARTMEGSAGETVKPTKHALAKICDNSAAYFTAARRCGGSHCSILLENRCVAVGIGSGWLSSS